MLAHQQPRSIGSRAERSAVRLPNVITGLIPFVCYIALAWTQRKRGLHDLLVHTLVVNGRVGETAPIKPRAGAGNGSFNA